jgi:hypothetical protein
MTVTTASANTRSPRVNRSGIAGDYLVVIGEPRRPAALVLERGTAALGTLKDEEEYQDERKRELLLDDKVGAQRRDFRV